MPSLDVYEALIDSLTQATEDRPRHEIEEKDVILALERILGSRASALETWETIAGQLRTRIVRNNYIVQWDMFRRVIKLSRLPTIEELESACELYQAVTPREIERRIRALSGIEFETFLASILSRLPEFREVKTTRQSHDEGVDLKGIYVPGPTSPHFFLIGQAKRVESPVTASQARDFIGAINIAEQRKKFGLFVSTGGFTQPAVEAFDKCDVPVMRWDLATLIDLSKEVTMKSVALSFGIPDNTFWEEVLGRS